MTHLVNAPLVYTIGLVRFPPVPQMERFVPGFHDLIRGSYPYKDEHRIKQMQVEFGSNGVVAREEELTIWQFAAPDRKLALVLGSDILAMHTIAYRDHKTFIAEFGSVLAKFVEVPGIGVSLITATALRYIDLVRSDRNEALETLLDPTVLPGPLTGAAEDLEIVEGVYIARYRAPKGEARLQVLRTPPTVLPPDLDTPLIHHNNWTIPRPEQPFAVVDTDCSFNFPDATSLDVHRVCDHMYGLRAIGRSIFDKIGTAQAQRIWEGKS